MTRIFLAALAAYLIAASSFAMAAPSVLLKLSGALVSKVADGSEKSTPLSDVALKPGQAIRYDIVATNKGDQVALNFIPVGKIPAGTTYVVGSVASGAEFSLNGGKTWSAKPMITVHTPTGDVTKAADPATYTNVRWIPGRSLAPGAIATYTYEVRVK